MKWFLLVIGIQCFLSCATKSQTASTTASTDHYVLHDAIRMMEFDPLGHLYLVDASDRLLKFDTTGILAHSVVNNNLGQIHSLDVGNPFKIMLFYRDQQTIILYDRTLSEIQRIPLIQWELQDVTAAGLAPDNALWLFNGLKKVLVKMSDTGDPILTSDPFDILNPVSARPDFIYDTDHFLLLKEAGQPMALFNDFGNYLRPLNINDELFSISKDGLVIHKNSSFVLFRIEDQSEIPFFSIQEPWIDKKTLLFEDKLYYFDHKGIFSVPVNSRNER